MKFKRIFLTALAGLLMISLCACGEGDKNSENSKAASQTASAQDKSSETKDNSKKEEKSGNDNSYSEDEPTGKTLATALLSSFHIMLRTALSERLISFVQEALATTTLLWI